MMVEVAVAAENQLGEGVIWSPQLSRVLWADIPGKSMWSFDPATNSHTKTDLGERLSAVVMLSRSKMLVAFASGLAYVDVETGKRTEITKIEPDMPTTRLNDAKLDRQGRFVVGTMDETEQDRRPIGQVWSFDGRSEPRILFGGVRISNGIAFSPDGSLMYFADTPTKRIDVFDYDIATGTPSNRRVFVELSADSGYPDGSTVDSEGCLWNAEWGGSRIVRYTPKGKIDRVIALPAPLITCCAFGGPGLSTLFVTSARTGLDEKAIATAPLSGALFAINVGIQGLKDAPFGSF